MASRRRPYQRAPEPAKLAIVAGRVPPHALDAEAAVISTCLLKPERIDLVAGILRRPDWYNDAHREIWSVLLEMRASGAAIDTVTVAHELRRQEKLAQVGGAAYLIQVTDATPAVSNVEAHAELVADAARRRTLIAACQGVVAEGYGEVAPGWVQSSVQIIAEAGDVRAPRGAIHSAWSKLDLDWLMVPPAARRWLLRHPTRDGEECAPGHGDGLLPLGKSGLLSSAGGVGKTMVLAQLAVCVALGLPWLGHFDVSHEAVGGKVLLALAEEDLEEVHRRVYTVADSLDLTDEQRRKVAELVVVLPLAGRPVAIVAPSPDGIVEETDELRALRQRLKQEGGERGWSLIVLDPLARWAGADTESDNAAATRFVQAVESLVEVPGHPTVLVAHHSSKMARRDGKADSRGVTAITDGFRWESTLAGVKGEVVFALTKSNYSRPMVEDIRLVRGKGGMLAVPDEAEIARREHFKEEAITEREAKANDFEEDRIAKVSRDMLAALDRVVAPMTTRAQVCSLIGGRKAFKEAALSRLMASGRIFKKKGAGFVVVPAAEAVPPKPDPDAKPAKTDGKTKTGTDPNGGQLDLV